MELDASSARLSRFFLYYAESPLLDVVVSTLSTGTSALPSRKKFRTGGAEFAIIASLSGNIRQPKLR